MTCETNIKVNLVLSIIVAILIIIICCDMKSHSYLIRPKSVSKENIGCSAFK